MASGHPSIDTGFEKGGPTICLRSASCRRSTVTSSACSPTGKTIIGERGSWREIGNKIVARGFTFRPNHLKLPSPPKHSRMPMGRAVEHRWYGDVARSNLNNIVAIWASRRFSRRRTSRRRTMTSAIFHCERILRRSAA
jgi:hypothetical protein